MLMKLVYLLGLLLNLNTAYAQTAGSRLPANPDDNTLLWEVSGNGLTLPSYLFGTFHLLCKQDILLSDALKRAISNSHEVYLELDLDDPATVMGALMLMNMKDGKRLKELYTPDQYQRISDYFKDSLNTPITLFQRMKPEFLIALLYPKMMPCNTATSVEEGVMQLAKENGKEIKGLETMAFQASLFDSIPYDQQAASLLKNIDSMERSRVYFNQMLDAYTHQRLDEIEKIVNTPEFGGADNLDILLYNRNKNWVGQLKTIMKKNPVFTAVGAGHLVGKNGLISLLRAEGFTVRGLENR
jgi:uncharacterized protein YbaP (TraB family)